MKEKINNDQKGITLIALVITIVVLLILAGVAISMLSGENGILRQAAKAKLMQEIAQVEELLNLKALEITDGTIKTAIMTELGKMGYETEEKTTTQATVKGLLIQDSTGANIENVNLIQNGVQSITIKLDTEGNTTSKTYIIIQNKKFEIMINDGAVKISREEYVETAEDQEAFQIKLTPPTAGVKMYAKDTEITTDTNIADNTNIKIRAGESTGAFNFKVEESKSGASREVSVNVEANQAYATKLTIGIKDNAEATIAPGGTLQLEAKKEPIDSTDTVSWQVESGAATISDTGLLTADSSATEGSKITVIATCVRSDGTTSNVQGRIEITIKEDKQSIASLKESGEPVSGKKATLLDTNDEQIVIPVGFYIKSDSPILVKDGIVVVAPDESEFVWVPVPEVSKMYGTNSNGNKLGKLYKFTDSNVSNNTANNWTETNGVMSWTSRTGYREPDYLECTTNGDAVTGNSTKGIGLLKSIVGLTGTNEEILNQWKTNLQNEFDDMIDSVSKNKGFYVGRYETSLNGTKAQSKKGVTSATGTSDTWYGLYQKEKEYSSKNNFTNVVGSGMIWGSQYDQMMIWMQKNGYNVASTTPKAGVSYNNSKTTGKNGNPDVMNNVNDLIGCNYEWILEASNTYYRVCRGGYSSNSFSNRPADRANSNKYGSPYSKGFSYASSRLTLYVK